MFWTIASNLVLWMFGKVCSRFEFAFYLKSRARSVVKEKNMLNKQTIINIDKSYKLIDKNWVSHNIQIYNKTPVGTTFVFDSFTFLH